MNTNTKERIDLFLQNTQLMKGKFIWQNTILKRFSSLLYAVNNKNINIDAIQDSYTYIKENTGVFSQFRGNTLMTIATLLSLSDNMEVQFKNSLSVYNLMKEANFRASDHLIIAAFQIASSVTSDKYSYIISRTNAFYEGMKKQHYFLTGQNDYIFCTMLALSDVEVSIGLDRMELLYQFLKPHFYSHNGVQSLTHVLVLGENIEEIETGILSLNKLFRQNGIKLNNEHTLPSLGVLSLLPVEESELVLNVKEVFDYLRTKKGFSSWSISTQELLLLSISIVVYGCTDNIKDTILASALTTSLTNIIIAQQVTIAIAVSSSTAAAATSSSSQ